MRKQTIRGVFIFFLFFVGYFFLNYDALESKTFFTLRNAIKSLLFGLVVSVALLIFFQIQDEQKDKK